MSIRKELFRTMESLPVNDEGWIVASTAELAESLDRDPNLVSKMINSLAKTGNIEAKKDEQSGKIIAFRILRAPRAYNRGGKRTPSVRRSEREQRPHKAFGLTMRTPNVDEYERAKEAYERSLPEFNQYVSAEWKGSPLAEEALALKKHNAALLSQLREMQERLNPMRRELEYLRKVQSRELRKGLKDAGVLVEHAG